MTLKPPAKTFPKLVMKEWPMTPENIHSFDREAELDRMKRFRERQVSDFTRVLEGVEGQKRPQKERSRDE